MYTRADIDRVRDRTDLVELAQEITKIKRSGRSVMAVCPFHSEKTPSLSIDPARGLYHCFGCGKSGDVFRWVQETQGLDFTEAVELLARRAGVTITPEKGASRRRDRREALVAATEAAVAFYTDTLKTGPDAGAARAYVRSRGYDGDIVDRFRLGYSPSDWDRLVAHLRDLGVRDDVMVAAGLASRTRKGGIVDRFRGRLMFPIFDLRGDAVGFGARLLEGDGPKYLNSPETAIYHKSRLLYGLNWAKSEIVRSGASVVVEGYTDVIAFHLAGMPVAVATCGTALGVEHLDLLRRFSERVVLAFDADEAGTGAALRGFEKSVPGDLDLRVAALPEGRDPADVVADGDVDILVKAIDGSMPLLRFRIERELERFDLSEAEGRGRAVRAAAALISLHPDAVVRHEYAVVVARRTGVELAVVEAAVRGAGRPAPEQGPPVVTDEPLSGVAKAEREVLRLLLANDPEIRAAELSADMFTRADHRRAYEMIAPALAGLRPGEAPDLGSLIGADGSPLGAMLRSLALDRRPLPEAAPVMNRLKEGALQRRIDELRVELDGLDPSDERYSDTFARLIALERQRRELREVE